MGVVWSGVWGQLPPLFCIGSAGNCFTINDKMGGIVADFWRSSGR